MKIIVWKQKAACWLAGALALCMAGYVVLWPATAAAYASERQLPIYCVDKEQKVCSISFDAAWADVKQRTLRLKAYNVRCLLSRRISRYCSPFKYRL